MPTHKAIHIAKSRNANRTSQNLSISMSFANALRRMKTVANLKEKMVENKECQCLTLCISNGGQSAKFETNMNKTNGSARMKVSAIKPATTHTLDRYLSLKGLRKI